MARRFELVREDHDAVNPPGVAAEGILFSSGKVAMCWTSDPVCIVNYDNITDVIRVQRQNRITRLVWLDQNTPQKTSYSAGSDASLHKMREELDLLLGQTPVVVFAEEHSDLTLQSR